MLYHIYYVSLFVTFSFCLYSYRSLDPNFKWLLPFFGFCIAFETANELGWLIINHTNSWSSNFEEIMECVLFTYFMASLSSIQSYRKKVYFFAAAVVLLSMADMLFIQGIWKLNTIAIVLQALFILTLISIYYYRLLDKAEEGLELIKHPPFLVVTGLLFYFLGKSFYYTCFSYMAYKNNYHFYLLAATLPGLANLMLNFLLIYAFLCFKKQRKSQYNHINN
nr:hypothetical protein [Mucilaginibacter sp. FT3.2]